jgi:uncharacterized protein YkwD
MTGGNAVHLRRPVASAVLTIAVALAASAPAPVASGALAGPRPASVRVVGSLEDGLLREINSLRADRGLGSLRASPGLARAAGAHARSMARLGFFAHVSPDGSSVRDRIARVAGLARNAVGEVLLWRSPAPNSSEALAMWLGSPPHRAVLLDPGLRMIGLTALSAQSAPGVFGGLDVTIVAADLAG